MYAPARTPALLSPSFPQPSQAHWCARVREQLIQLGYEPTAASPDKLGVSALETQRWGPLIKAVGFSAD